MKFSASASARVSRMVRLAKIAVFISVLLLTPHAYAQDLSIAVVDVEQILSESSAGKSIQQQLKNRREAFQAEFSAREDTLAASQKTLVAQQDTLSKEEFAEKRQSFESQLLETRKLFQKRRNALDTGLSDALSALRKNIIEVTAAIADEKNYQVVLTRDAVVIVEKEMDITADVLVKLNAKISTIPLKME